MARYAVLDGDVVVNIIEAAPDFAVRVGAIRTEAGNVGDVWDGEGFVAPAMEPVGGVDPGLVGPG